LIEFDRVGHRHGRWWIILFVDGPLPHAVGRIIVGEVKFPIGPNGIAHYPNQLGAIMGALDHQVLQTCTHADS